MVLIGSLLGTLRSLGSPPAHPPPPDDGHASTTRPPPRPTADAPAAPLNDRPPAHHGEEAHDLLLGGSELHPTVPLGCDEQPGSRSRSPSTPSDAAICSEEPSLHFPAVGDGHSEDEGDSHSSHSSGSSISFPQPTIQVLTVPRLEPSSVVKDLHAAHLHFVGMFQDTPADDVGVKTRQASRKGTSARCSTSNVP